MLAILLIEMEWSKDSRTPQGAAARQQYYKPVLIDEDVNLSGEGVFVKKCKFYQKDNIIQSASELVDAQAIRLDKETKGQNFTGNDEYEQRRMRKGIQSIIKAKGVFVPIERIDIPCIAVEKEENDYRIKWFDYKGGMPRRRGGNEDFGKAGARLAGEPNVLNETAFILKEGQSGMLKYNYRYTSYHGQWYKCFYVYVVNCNEMTNDAFIREYNFEYSRMADLF